jgi:hypothetical protein
MFCVEILQRLERERKREMAHALLQFAEASENVAKSLIAPFRESLLCDDGNEGETENRSLHG